MRIRKSLTIALLTSAALVTGGAAFAADLPIGKAQPVAIAPNWTGFYGGLGIGYGMYNAESDQVAAAAGGFAAAQGTSGGRGFFASAVVGFDYQLAPSWVVGAFADYQLMSIKGDHLGPGADPPTTGVGSLKQDWAWAVGARLGYLVTPQILTYFTAGFTQTHFDGVSYQSVLPGVFGVPPTRLELQTYNGLFLGSGVEYHLPWFRNLTARTEYRFAEFERKQVPLVTIATGAPSVNAELIKPYSHTVRGQIVYRFSGPAASSYALPLPAASNVPARGWTGFFGGGGLGYGLYNVDSSEIAPGGITVPQGTTGGRGWFGSAVAGFDWQFAPTWVAGVFGDYQLMDVAGTHIGPSPTGAVTLRQGSLKQDWAWAVGARLGYLMSPKMLTYGTAGYTQTHFDGVAYRPLAGPVAADNSLPDQTYSGWFIGSGVEYQLPWIAGLSARTEYRYAQYDQRQVANINPATGSPTGFSETIRPYSHTIRGQILYRFDGPRM